MPDDFIENIKRRDAAERARQAAVDPPSRRSAPRRATNGNGVGGYAQQALSDACRNIETASEGTRNDTANIELFNMGQLIAAGELTVEQVKRDTGAACRRAGLGDREIRLLLRDSENSGINKGMAKPRDMEKVAAQRIPAEAPRRTSKAAQLPADEDARRIIFRTASTVKTKVPQWVWKYNDVGRIQLGTFTMFAGKSGTGKSTAMRWFAARLSCGELPGVWAGAPMRVAMLSPEEQQSYIMAPSLEAAGANMNNVDFPEVWDAGAKSGFLAQNDEARLTEGLLDNNIRAVFVDPVIQTIGGKADINRNNEIRDHLMPWTRIAEAINGVVIGVTHFRKGETTNVMDSLNGSSAFVELPRAVFGFAYVADGLHIMEQVKNSAGPVDLRLLYKLPVQYGQADDGLTYEMTRFEISSDTEISISDLGGSHHDEDLITAQADAKWLDDYLRVEQPAPSKQVKVDAINSADISVSRLHKARKKLKVQIIKYSTPDKPYQTAWALPDFNRALWLPNKGVGEND